MTDAGQGTLTVSSVTAAAANSGTWLAAATVSGGISVTADPTGLTPNTYTGTVTIASNGVNGNIAIPVQLTVVAQGPPLASAGGAVNNGTFANGEPLAQGDIAAVFGNQFTFDAPQSAGSLPLLTTLDEVQVLVNGKAAPLYYIVVRSNQFRDSHRCGHRRWHGPGAAQRHGGESDLCGHRLAQAPRFIVYDGGYGIMTTADGSAKTGIPSHPVKIGDTVVIYAIGLGPTSPLVASGTASPGAPAGNVPGTTKVCFGVETPFHQAPCATAAFSGLTPGFVALYQINVTIPPGIASGNTTMSLILENNISSDPALLAVQ